MGEVVERSHDVVYEVQQVVGARGRWGPATEKPGLVGTRAGGTGAGGDQGRWDRGRWGPGPVGGRWGSSRRGYTWKRYRAVGREGQSGLILRFIQIFGLGLNCAAPG